MNRSDNRIRQAVMSKLRCQPSLDASGIIVDVERGAVTLSGHVHSQADKTTAGRITKCVRGVRAIAFNIHVLCSILDNDTEIAAEIADLLTWDIALRKERIQATVDDAWVTLEGEVNDHCQKVAAFNAVSNVKSVKGISNLITVKP